MATRAKLEQALLRFQQLEPVLACPICRTMLRTQPPTSLLCQRHHSFDLAKNGMVHLVAGPTKTQPYEKRLFEQRHRLSQSGLFRPLLIEVAAQLGRHWSGHSNKILLDAGCGSGFALHYVREQLGLVQERPYGLGVDLAKAGVHLAAKTYDCLSWAVADLANLPLQAGTCQGILNVLSPSNYSEFRRVLAPEGVVIKVLPTKAYLQEIREISSPGEELKQYSNDAVLDRFRQEMHLLRQTTVRYLWPIKHEEIRAFLEMSPLTWNLPLDSLEAVLASGRETVTMEFMVLVGARRQAN